MKLITTLTDADFGLFTPFPAEFENRLAARAVVFDGKGNVALLHLVAKKCYKLPGGGVEEGEDILETLARELREEIGCEVTNLRELGMIEEFRAEGPLHQLSYCFLADVAGEKGITNLTEKEIADGSETMWMDLASAAATLEGIKTDTLSYHNKFMVARDLAFLKEAAR